MELLKSVVSMMCWCMMQRADLHLKNPGGSVLAGVGFGGGSLALTRRSPRDALLLYDTMGGSGKMAWSSLDLWRVGRELFNILGIFAVALE